MKLLLLIVGVFVSGTFYAQSDSILVNTTMRHYLVHTPPSYVPGTPMPIVIALHGFFGWGAQLQQQSQLSLKADASGFIVVYPDGLGDFFSSWNAGACCSYAATNNIDDVGFIDNLIDTLAADYSVDMNRVYATGHSNGAMMTYRLGCELSDRIAAIAPVAGAFQMITPCVQSRMVPVIHFHSYLDTDVPGLGGLGSTPPNLYFPPVDSLLNVLAANGSCTVSNDSVYQGPYYDHVQWSGCDCGYTNELYMTYDGGHSWPGGNATFSGDTVSTAINANDLMWDFFQLHSLDCPASELTDVDQLQSFSLFPNPVMDQLYVQFAPSSEQRIIIKIVDVHGSVIQEVSAELMSNLVEIDASNFQSGVYMLTIHSEDEISRTERFVKL